jgi:hypothetical protein
VPALIVHVCSRLWSDVSLAGIAGVQTESVARVARKVLLPEYADCACAY